MPVLKYFFSDGVGTDLKVKEDFSEQLLLFTAQTILFSCFSAYKKYFYRRFFSYHFVSHYLFTCLLVGWMILFWSLPRTWFVAKESMNNNNFWEFILINISLFFSLDPSKPASNKSTSPSIPLLVKERKVKGEVTKLKLVRYRAGTK